MVYSDKYRKIFLDTKQIKFGYDRENDLAFIWAYTIWDITEAGATAYAEAFQKEEYKKIKKIYATDWYLYNSPQVCAQSQMFVDKRGNMLNPDERYLKGEWEKISTDDISYDICQAVKKYVSERISDIKKMQLNAQRVP